MPFDAADFKVDPLTITEPKARLEYLRDFLRTLPEERFDILSFADAPGWPEYCDDPISAADVRNDCGTTACIAGWAEALFTEVEDIGGNAEELLGLGEPVANKLFHGFPRGNIRPAQAADVLDHLIRTGEVDWSVAQAAP